MGLGIFKQIGGMFGGTNQNANYSAQGAPLYQVASPEQIQGAYKNAQQGLDNQNSLNSLLAAQNGIGNQSSVYSQQQDLARALLAQSQGAGPNPAQDALNQNTGANIASQAALMAGQRGAGANVGLMARQIANQGANTQQQAVGQGATMQAQQQLAAQQALMQQQAQMANLATTQVGQQQAGVNTFASNSLNEQSLLNNAALGYNNANVAMQGNQNDANQRMAGINAGIANQNTGNLMNNVSSVFGGAIGGNTGGAVKGLGGGFSRGGMVGIPSHLKSVADIYHSDKFAFGGEANNQPQQDSGGLSDLIKLAPLLLASKGGKVDAMVSPGEEILKPNQVKKFSQGDKSVLRNTEKVPGKAKVSGDSEKNDTVPKKLDDGSVVIPRSKTGSEEKENFLAGLLNKYADQEGNGEDEFREALKKAISSRRKA